MDLLKPIGNCYDYGQEKSRKKFEIPVLCGKPRPYSSIKYKCIPFRCASSIPFIEAIIYLRRELYSEIRNSFVSERMWVDEELFICTIVEPRFGIVSELQVFVVPRRGIRNPQIEPPATSAPRPQC